MLLVLWCIILKLYKTAANKVLSFLLVLMFYKQLDWWLAQFDHQEKLVRNHIVNFFLQGGGGGMGRESWCFTPTQQLIVQWYRLWKDLTTSACNGMYYGRTCLHRFVVVQEGGRT